MIKKHIHFVGIKGVGMTPLAIIAKEAGYRVSGCDVSDEFITDEPLKKVNIEAFVGFTKDHLTNVDIVITTGAHGGFDNPEVKAAREKGLKVITQGEALGMFMDGEFLHRKFEGISIAGCHGKTTTTAMIATILNQAGFDPSYVIGTSSSIPLGLPGHFGKGKYFIAEADEYATEPVYDKTPKFLWQRPKIAVITNIEFDHPDLYPTINEVREAYVDFTKNIQTKGILIVNIEDVQSKKLLEKYKGKIVSFGFNSTNADYSILNYRGENEQTIFSIANNGKFIISLPGKHNVLNATAAIIVARELGISLEAIKTALPLFKGTKRRLEYKGTLPSGTKIYDDYAHHPTEIIATLTGLRQIFPKSKIILIFQPHTYSRTKLLFEEFSYSFINTDLTIITEIFPSAREPVDSVFSAKLLAEKIIERSEKDEQNKDTVIFLPGLQDVVKYINKKHFGSDTVVITMGAGDVYKIGETLLKS